LFSIGKALQKGFNLGHDGEIIKLTKESVTLTFDEVVRTKNGFARGIRLTPVSNDHGMPVIESKRSNLIDINNLHKILGHCGEVRAILTGKALGYGVTGKFDACEACSVSKARQNFFGGGRTTPGERLYIDTSSIKGNCFGGAKFRTLIVDDYSSYCWSYCFKRNDELANKLVDFIKELREKKLVMFLRLDDAGEHYELVRMKNLVSSLNIVDLAHLKEMEKWNGSSKHYMDESEQ
jgi:hypothetical protein